MKAFADVKIYVTEKLEFGEGRKHCGKEEMLVTNIFSISHNIMKSLLFQGHSNSRMCGKCLTHTNHRS